jgi:hypothetical protein
MNLNINKTKDVSVVQSNNFITSSYNVSNFQIRFILLLMLKIKKNKKSYYFDNDELNELLSFYKISDNRYIDKIRQLQKKIISIESKISSIDINLITRAEYIK